MTTLLKILKIISKMNFLLDTHTFIWFVSGDKNLSSKARKAIESTEATNFVSIVSLWEMAIKVSLDRLELKGSFERIEDEIFTNGFQMLPITFKDTLILSSLPFHHNDPFDRLLIAQGINNKLTIISKDRHFDNYKIKLVW